MSDDGGGRCGVGDNRRSSSWRAWVGVVSFRDRLRSDDVLRSGVVDICSSAYSENDGGGVGSWTGASLRLLPVLIENWRIGE